jgi:excisionase family DNA binding protein
MVATALDAAIRLAERDGVSYQGRSQWDDVSWLREQARLVAEGRTGPASPDSADGTPPARFELVMPSSAPAPELLTVRQAAGVLRVTSRAVVKRIRAGQLPARRYGREWLMTEYDVRHAARNGDADASSEAAT